MSIFRRKGTIEGLFRIGAEEHLNTDAVAETPTRRGVKHEVYYVRGRPFIAPAAELCARSNFLAPADYSVDRLFATSRIVPTPPLSIKNGRQV